MYKTFNRQSESYIKQFAKYMEKRFKKFHQIIFDVKNFNLKRSIHILNVGRLESSHVQIFCLSIITPTARI